MQSREFIKEQDDVIQLKDKSSSKAQEFVDKIYRTGYINPLDSSLVVLYSTGDTFSQFDLRPAGENTVRISFMQAYPLRSGAGSKGMQKLQKLAAEAGITLTGDIWEKGPVKPAALKKFYQKMGFDVKGNRITWVPPQPLAEDKKITVQDIHALADRKKIKWDNDRAFMDMTEYVTGKRHLDQLTQQELKKFYDWLILKTPEKIPKKLSKSVINALEKNGYTRVGSGGSAEVWMKEKGKVAKIVMNANWQSRAIRTAYTFYRLVKRFKPSLPNLPRYVNIDGSEFFKFKIGNTPFIQINMENLEQITDNVEKDLINFLSDIARKEQYKSIWKELVEKKKFPWPMFNQNQLLEKILQTPEKYQLLLYTMRVLYEFGKSNQFHWDLPWTNVMVRPSTKELVITDPWV